MRQSDGASTAPNGLCSRVCVTSKRTKDSPVEDRWQLSDSERRTRRWQDTHTHKKWGPLHYQTKRLNVFASRNKKLSDSGVIPSPPPMFCTRPEGATAYFDVLLLSWLTLPYLSCVCVCVCAYTQTHGVKDTRGNQMWTHTIDMLCVGCAGNPSSWRWVTVSFTFSTE